MNYLRSINRTSPGTILARASSSIKMTSRKPPNIFIYDGLETETESYGELKSLVESCLEVNSYTVYHLSKRDMVVRPWLEHTKLLLVTEKEVAKTVRSQIIEHLKNDGSLLAICSDIDEDFVGNREESFSDVALCNGEHLYVEGTHVYVKLEGMISLAKANDSPVVVRTQTKSAGFSMFSRVGTNIRALLPYLLAEFGLEMRKSDHVPELTSFHLFSLPGDDHHVEEIETCLKTTISRKGLSLPILRNKDSSAFDIGEYWTLLKTRTVGKIVLFSEVTGSTNDTLEDLMCHIPSDSGLVAIAHCQTKGRGRSGNAWLSPKGSACFSFLINVPVVSALGKAVPFVQHIAALAVVLAVKNWANCSRLKVKWPNDIYSDDGRKLGGVLVKSSLFQRDILAVIGCGVNVNNEKPTVCINDLIDDESRKISVEALIATSLTEFERLMNIFQTDRSQFLDLYYDNWLHSGQKVKLRQDGLEETVDISGLDDNGYLNVKNNRGEVRSVHPDGNSFDMMHGLIYAK